MQRTIDGEVRRGIAIQLLFNLLLIAIGIAGALATFDRAGAYLRSWNFVKLSMLVLGTLGMTLYGVWNFRRNLRWRSNLYEHPTFVCPAFGPPSAVRQALQHVLDSPGAIKVGSTLVTADWLLEVDRWRVQSVYLPSIVWYYHTVTEHKHFRWGVISIRKTYNFHIWTADGTPFICGEIQEAEINQLLALVAQRSPAALCGHSAETEKLWFSDRARFLQTIDHRRHCLAQEAEAAGS